MTPPNDSWLERAACKRSNGSTVPAHIWNTPGKNQGLIDRALATCARCPVLRECRADLEAWGDHVGIRGGELHGWSVPHNATGTGAMR